MALAKQRKVLVVDTLICLLVFCAHHLKRAIFMSPLVQHLVICQDRKDIRSEHRLSQIGQLGAGFDSRNF